MHKKSRLLFGYILVCLAGILLEKFDFEFSILLILAFSVFSVRKYINFEGELREKFRKKGIGAFLITIQLLTYKLSEGIILGNYLEPGRLKSDIFVFSSIPILLLLIMFFFGEILHRLEITELKMSIFKNHYLLAILIFAFTLPFNYSFLQNYGLNFYKLLELAGVNLIFFSFPLVQYSVHLFKARRSGLSVSQFIQRYEKLRLSGEAVFFEHQKTYKIFFGLLCGIYVILMFLNDYLIIHD